MVLVRGWRRARSGAGRDSRKASHSAYVVSWRAMRKPAVSLACSGTALKKPRTLASAALPKSTRPGGT